MLLRLLATMALALMIWPAYAQWQVAEQPDLADRLAAAPPLATESLGPAVRTVRVGESMLVPNPDRETWDILQWYFKGYSGPTACYIVDTADGSVRLSGIPDGQQIHICGRCLAPDGKLWIATPIWKEGMVLYCYDPATNELSSRGVVVPGLAGETRPLVLGTDGYIYGTGSYGDDATVGAYRLDWRTGEVTDYGRLGPSHKPSGSWGYYIGADDTHVYVASGKEPWYLIAYERATGKQEVILETERVDGIITIRQLHDGVTASARKVLGRGDQSITYWLYQGRAIEKTDETPPWPARPAPENPWPPRPELYTEKLDPDPSGHAELWYRLARDRDAAAGVPAEAPPEQRGWKRVDLQVTIYPLQIDRLAELPDGRIIGTCDAYQGNFIVDPAKGSIVHPGKIALSHYATAVSEGLVYMSGYPSAPVYVYDPNRPWTVGHGSLAAPAPAETDPSSNPRLVVRLSEHTRCHKMFDAAVGADGKIYFGGRLYRNGNGGGLGWWDPATGQTGGIWQPFSAYRIYWVKPALNGTKLVISTLAVRDDLNPAFTPEQGRLFVWDVARAEIERYIEPIAGLRDTGALLEVAPGRILCASADPQAQGAGLLYGVDITTGELLFTKKVPQDFQFNEGTITNGTTDFRLGPDGRVWTWLGNRLIRINPADVSIEVLGTVSPPGRLAFAGADVYLAGTEELRVIRGLAAH